MPLKPCPFCFCCKIYVGCKLICVIEILRVCITGFILIIEAVTTGMSILLFHYIFRNTQPVSLMFSYLSIHSIRVFTCLNNRDPHWTVLKIYYRLKLSVSLSWLLEITILLTVQETYYHTDYIPISITILSYIGISIDLYFSYSIYSCMVLGQNGVLVIHPSPVSAQNLGTQPNDDIYVAREFKEVMAYPIQPIPPECEFVAVYDYTKGKSDN